MKTHKKWEVISRFKIQDSRFKIEEIIDTLLKNRGLSSKKEIEDFLNPKLETVTPEAVGIDLMQLKKRLKRIKKAIEGKEKIVVFGDYDVDGITGTAILCETLYDLGADVMPFIPSRIEEGYGLSKAGINNVILNLFQDPKKIPIPPEADMQVRNDKKMLIITVDNGIVANEAVK